MLGLRLAVALAWAKPVGVAQPATRRMRARIPLVLVACIRSGGSSLPVTAALSRTPFWVRLTPGIGGNRQTARSRWRGGGLIGRRRRCKLDADVAVSNAAQPQRLTRHHHA